MSFTQKRQLICVSLFALTAILGVSRGASAQQASPPLVSLDTASVFSAAAYPAGGNVPGGGNGTGIQRGAINVTLSPQNPSVGEIASISYYQKDPTFLGPPNRARNYAYFNSFMAPDSLAGNGEEGAPIFPCYYPNESVTIKFKATKGVSYAVTVEYQFLDINLNQPPAPAPKINPKGLLVLPGGFSFGDDLLFKLAPGKNGVNPVVSSFIVTPNKTDWYTLVICNEKPGKWALGPVKIQDITLK